MPRGNGLDDVKSPIRLTPPFFYLMLTLTEGVSHGYAMAQEVQERSDGSVKLGPGSLYWSLGRLSDVGLIGEVPAPEGETDERRRYYDLTPYGRKILTREVSTLAGVVEYARLKRIV